MLNKSLTSLFFTLLGFTLVSTGSILGSQGRPSDFFQRAEQRFQESGGFNSPFFQQAEERFQESGGFDNPFFRNNISENDNSTSSSRSEAAKKESARKKARAEEMTRRYLAFELAKEQEARESKEQALKNQQKLEEQRLAELQKQRQEEEKKLNEICLRRKEAEQEQQLQKSGYVRFHQQLSQPTVPVQPSNNESTCPQPQEMIFVGQEVVELNQPQLQPLAHVASASDDEFSRPNVAFLPTTMVYDYEQPVVQQQPSEGRKQASAPEKKAEDFTKEEIEMMLQNQDWQ